MPEIFGHPAALAAFGLLIGFLGSLIGVGGGFLMIPYFALLAKWAHPVPVGASLGVIALNATSGVLTFTRQKRIDYVVGLALGVASIPGTYVGTLLANVMSGGLFKIAFAGLGLIAAALLANGRPSGPARPSWFRRGVRRRFVDAYGHAYDYSLNLWAASALSILMGVIAGLFGVGGGFIHVPLLILLFGMPEHVSMATSHFILIITALVGSLEYAIDPAITPEMRRLMATAWLWVGAGAVVGAQVGARAAARLSGRALRRIFAAILVVVAILMAWRGWREST